MYWRRVKYTLAHIAETYYFQFRIEHKNHEMLYWKPVGLKNLNYELSDIICAVHSLVDDVSVIPLHLLTYHLILCYSTHISLSFHWTTVFVFC